MVVRTEASEGPTTGGIIGALAFWVIAALLVLATTSLTGVPGWVWALRIILALGGVGLAIGLIAREKSRERRGLPLDRDDNAFDYWTIAHTTAGLVMGAWGVPGVLVIIFTVGWEIFEYKVKGFGDKEIFTNRVVDIAVAVVGWIIVAGIVALTTHTPMPWVAPLADAWVRGGGLHLF